MTNKYKSNMGQVVVMMTLNHRFTKTNLRQSNVHDHFIVETVDNEDGSMAVRNISSGYNHTDWVGQEDFLFVSEYKHEMSKDQCGAVNQSIPGATAMSVNIDGKPTLKLNQIDDGQRQLLIEGDFSFKKVREIMNILYGTEA